ncbi:MAG: murein hydrolase activator EnvC family protein [Bacteroidales bacterium]
MFKQIFLFCFILMIIAVSSFAQKKVNSLQQQKKKIESDISKTNLLINKTKSEQKLNIESLSLVQNNISSRKTLISTIDKYLAILSNEIEKKTKRITELQENLVVLKDNYANMVVFAYRSRNTYQQLMYVFASENISQVYRRMSYLKIYSDHRIAQAKEIKKQSESIVSELELLNLKRIEQENLLGQKTKELKSLDSEQAKYQQILTKLQSRQQELTKDLNAKKKQAAQLDRQIENAIAAEARAERERRRVLERKNKKEADKVAKFEKTVSDKFARLKGLLKLPVVNGVIITGFGIHNHPVLKGIKVTSNGIDILSVEGAVVSVVAEGVVRKVFNTGLVTSVLIQHGEYYTVYTYLKSVTVKAGEKLKARQPIGLIQKPSDSDKAILHFELWEQSVKQDPQDWFIK